MMIAGHNITLATRHEESTPQPPRRVLMIAAAFPPIGGPGVQRSAKFAKYLPAFGWHPFVWTMDEMKGLPNDPSLLEDLPPEVTHSTPSESVPCVELSPT